MNEQEILKELENFNGSENFYKDFLGCLITDGFKTFCDRCKCYWLFSDMVVVIMEKFKNKEDFIVVKIKVDSEKKAVVTLEDGNNNKLYEQKYEYTDFPLKEYDVWAVFNEIGTYTFMLKGEY